MSNVILSMPEGKAAVQARVQSLKDVILSGNTDPIQVEVWLKGIEKVVEAVRGDMEVKEVVTDAISAYNEKTFEVYGARITKKMSAARYDFRFCEDVVWEMLDAELESLKEKIKNREDFLKTVKEPKDEINPLTGEIFVVKPPVKKQYETYSITLL